MIANKAVMKTLILGLGNPILGDDSIGWKVVEQVKLLSSESLDSNQIDGKRTQRFLEFECYAVGGISLMENLIGYDHVWIIDAIHTDRYPIGTLVCKKLDDFKDIPCGHLTSAHDMSLQTALELGRSIGADLPAEINIIGIETDIQFEFSDELSEPLRKTFPKVVNQVMHLIQQEANNDLS